MIFQNFKLGNSTKSYEINRKLIPNDVMYVKSKTDIQDYKNAHRNYLYIHFFS